MEPDAADVQRIVDHIAKEYSTFTRVCPCGTPWSLKEQLARMDEDGLAWDVITLVCPKCGKINSHECRIPYLDADKFPDEDLSHLKGTVLARLGGDGKMSVQDLT